VSTSCSLRTAGARAGARGEQHQAWTPGRGCLRVSLATISRYLPKIKPDPESQQRWTTFLRNHRDAIAAMDFEVHRVGSSSHEELWVPAEQLRELNRRIEGSIEIVAYFYREQFNQPIDPESRLPVQVVSRRR
jgi:hypothetical protein